jgi:iron complex transport system permease protein
VKPVNHFKSDIIFNPIIILFGLILLIFFSLGLGHQELGPGRLVSIIWGNFGFKGHESEETYQSIVFLVRLPRILLAVLIGAGLAASGAAFQTIFRNPLVSPEILGVSAGAGFGAALAMLFKLPPILVQSFALAFGLLAVALTLGIARVTDRASIMSMLLGGIVVTALFGAFLGVVKTLADPWNTLPGIVFWLLGSLARSSPRDVLMVLPATVLGLGTLFLFRYQIETLSAGHDEAKTMGVEPFKVRMVVVGAATLITAVGVSVCGMVGWIGLVTPHLARIRGGTSFPTLLVRSMAFGAILTLAIDDLIRSVKAAELPLGVMTALIGTPIFLILLPKTRGAFR